MDKFMKYVASQGKNMINLAKVGMKRNFEELEETPQGYALVQKAKEIAKKMAGNYSGAVKEIEKLQKGLSDNSSVQDALLKANESLDEEVKYPHKMYDPKTGKEVTAKTPEDHEKYAKMGYTHDKPKMEGLEDSPNPANSQHLCAKNVVHEEWGEGNRPKKMMANLEELHQIMSGLHNTIL